VVFSLGVYKIVSCRDSKKLEKTKYCLLAPIAVEILVCRGSANKIVTESGTNADKKVKTFCSKKYLCQLKDSPYKAYKDI
jgi:hypothetical protein